MLNLCHRPTQCFLLYLVLTPAVCAELVTEGMGCVFMSVTADTCAALLPKSISKKSLISPDYTCGFSLVI